MHLEKTKIWVADFVIAHSLCPFAATPFRKGEIRFLLSKAEEAEEILAELIMETEILSQSEKSSTSLLVIPTLLADFEDYLDLFAAAEDLFAEMGLDANWQLVSFHPDYLFANTTADDPANATNQSPFPLIHLLNREDVRKAISSHPDVHSIANRNIDLLRSMAKQKPGDSAPD